MTEEIMEQWLTVEQVANKLQVHPETVRRAIYRGQLRASKLNKATWRINPKDLQEYLDKQSNVSGLGDKYRPAA